LPRARHDLSFTAEGEHRLRLRDLNPTRFVYLMIVVGNVTAAVLEQEEVDAFVESNPLRLSISANVPIFDLLERSDDFRVDPRLLAHLASCCLDRRFSLVHDPLGQLPSPFRTHAHDRDFDDLSVGRPPVDDAASGHLLHRRQPRPRHAR